MICLNQLDLHKMKTKNIGPHYAAENLEWRAFVQYGLPGLVIMGLFMVIAQGIASSYPGLLVVAIAILGTSFYLQGKKSTHAVASVKLVNLAIVCILLTLANGNPMFAVIGIMLCTALFMMIKIKT